MEVVRHKHLALATERIYFAWLRRYCDFLKALPLHLPSEHKLERFLTVLAQKDVAVGTQNQAFNAVIRKVAEKGRSGLCDRPTFNLIGAGIIFKRATAVHRFHRWQICRSLGNAP